MKKEISGVYRIISVILSVLLVIQLSTVITLADAPEAEEQPEEVQFAVDHGASLITANELAPLLEILKK